MFERSGIRRRFSERGQQSAKVLLRRAAQRFVMKQREILVASELGEPVVHCLDDRHDAVTAITHQIADFFLFDLLWRLTRAMNQLHVEGDERVARVAPQQNNPGSGQLSCGHEIFSTDPVPNSSFHSLLGEIVRKDEPGNSRIVIVVGPEGEWPAGAFAKISAKKGADPGPSAFWH